MNDWALCGSNTTPVAESEINVEITARGVSQSQSQDRRKGGGASDRALVAGLYLFG